MLELPNYLTHTPNPFNLVGPPAWFQKQMRAQDPDMVIFPSQEEGVYRIARRVPHGHISRYSLAYIARRPDTKTYIDNGLSPVTSLLPFVQWGPVVLSDLASMDMQRYGGANAVADMLEKGEDSREAQVNREIADLAGARAADYYRTDSYVSGSRVFQTEQKGRTKTRRRSNPTFRPPNFTGGSAVFVSR